MGNAYGEEFHREQVAKEERKMQERTDHSRMIRDEARRGQALAMAVQLVGVPEDRSATARTVVVAQAFEVYLKTGEAMIPLEHIALAEQSAKYREALDG